MKKQQVKAGVIGCGEAGKLHSECLHINPKSKLVAVCDLNRERAKKVADKFKVDYYTSIEDMISKESLDVVIVGTPPQVLKEPTIRAIESGCGVLTEKHLSLNLADAKEIQKAAQHNNVRVCVVRNELFLPVIQKALKLNSKSNVKEIHLSIGLTKEKLEEERHIKWVSDLPGGILGENSPHYIYLMRAFMGENPRDISASYSNGDLKVEMNGKKTVGIINVTKSRYLSSNILLLNDDGCVFIDKSNWSVTRHTYGGEMSAKKLVSNDFGVFTDAFSSTVGNLVRYGSAKLYRLLGFKKGYRVKPHYTQVDAFVRGLSKTENFSFDIDDGVENVRVYEDIWRQAGEL